MKAAFKVLLVSSALLALQACVVSGPGGGAVYYDGFYDGYYGPMHDGYWGDDRFFYHSEGPGRPFVRDEGNHFQRTAAPGYKAFHQAHAGPHGDHPHEAPHR